MSNNDKYSIVEAETGDSIRSLLRSNHELHPDQFFVDLEEIEKWVQQDESKFDRTPVGVILEGNQMVVAAVQAPNRDVLLRVFAEGVTEREIALAVFLEDPSWWKHPKYCTVLRTIDLVPSNRKA